LKGTSISNSNNLENNWENESLKSNYTNTSSDFYSKFNLKSQINENVTDESKSYTENWDEQKLQSNYSHKNSKTSKHPKGEKKKKEKLDSMAIMDKLLYVPPIKKSKHEFMPVGCSCETYSNDSYKSCCSHYERNFGERLTCCEKVFKCNFDHNDKVAKHQKGRIKNWICNKCNHDKNKPFSEYCMSCYNYFYSIKPSLSGK
jgi:hypothetical protein